MASAEFNVFCSFCDEPFTSQKAMIDHLMMCGNKTDQCPNCRKYIRRAIFAYHYENNCANPDAPTTDDDTHQTPQRSEKTRVSVKCEYCQQNYDKADSKAHKKNCLHNPVNRSKNQQSFNDENFNQNSDRSRPSNDSDDGALIPCEWCNQGVPLHTYQKHAEACQEKEHERLQEKARRKSQVTESATTVNRRTPPVTTVNIRTPSTTSVNIRTPSGTDSAPCKFCGRSMSSNGLSYHQIVCVKNPHRNKNS